MAGGRAGPFRVVGSESVARALKELQRLANERKVGRKFRIAVESIARQMMTDPEDFGEECYRLPALRQQIRIAVVPPVAVSLGVHEELPVVFVKNFELLMGPLE